MKSQPSFQIYALVLCIAALFSAQTFGLPAGYLCLCGGRALPTQATHCHGPHGPQCHDHGQDTGHSEGGQGDREDHAAVRSDLNSRSLEHASQVLAPPAVVLAVIWNSDLLFVPTGSRRIVWLAEESPPPTSVAVARTVVLLI